MALLLPVDWVWGSPEPVHAQRTSWAVVVGINDYLAYEDSSFGDLRGAERDARSFRQALLDLWHVPDDNIRLLLNTQATRAAIEEALVEWLGTEVHPGDRVFFFFAGHGSQAPDHDGDEEDGLDETLVPTDVDLDSYRRDIRDDDLRRWLANLPSPEIIVILDSCHSGTATREAIGYVQARSLPGRPQPVLSKARSNPTEEGHRASMASMDLGSVAVELAAAASNQSAMDAFFPGSEGRGGFYGGVFTTHLLEVLKRTRGTLTFLDLHRLVFNAVKVGRFYQDPQAYGQLDRSVFPQEAGGRRVAERSEPVGEAPRLIGKEDGRVFVSQGGNSGLRAGQVLRADGGAQVQLMEVQDERSIGRVLSGRVGGDEELRHASLRIPESRLLVFCDSLEPELLSAVERETAGEPGVELNPDPSPRSDLMLRKARDGKAVLLTGRDGALRGRVPFHELDRTAADLAAALRRELVVKQLSHLENLRPPFRVELGIRGRKRVFRFGEAITFSVVSEESGYLTLVDLDAEGTLTLLYPNPWTDSRGWIEAGQRVEVPAPSMGFSLRIAPPEGMGVVRAIVTKEPLRMPLASAASGGFLNAHEEAPAMARELLEALKIASWSGQVTDRERATQEILSESWASSLVTYQTMEMQPPAFSPNGTTGPEPIAPWEAHRPADQTPPLPAASPASWTGTFRESRQLQE